MSDSDSGNMGFKAGSHDETQGSGGRQIDDDEVG